MGFALVNFIVEINGLLCYINNSNHISAYKNIGLQKGENIMDAIVAILTRRFDNKIPDNELIQKVVNAGRYAPSGANSQTTHFIVITKKDVSLRKLLNWFKKSLQKWKFQKTCMCL